MRGVWIALGAGLGLLLIAIGLVLAHSPSSVASTNGIAGEIQLVTTRSSTSGCQDKEVLPAGISAIRLTLAAELGPRVSVFARSGGHVLTQGARGTGWTGAALTVPVKPIPHTTSNVEVCFQLIRPLGSAEVFGEPTPRTVGLIYAGRRLPARMGIEYMRPGHASWLSLIPATARRMGLGHAWAGTWIVFLLLAAMASGTILASWLVLQELG